MHIWEDVRQVKENLKSNNNLFNIKLVCFYINEWMEDWSFEFNLK